MFGGILGSHFPGSIYMMQSLMFKAPCFVGACVTARLEVASSRATHSLFLKRCSGFERECGKAGGDMALHSNGAAFAIVSNVLLRAFLFTTLQSSEGTLLIDGEARMKAPLSLELALQK